MLLRNWVEKGITFEEEVHGDLFLHMINYCTAVFRMQLIDVMVNFELKAKFLLQTAQH